MPNPFLAGFIRLRLGIDVAESSFHVCGVSRVPKYDVRDVVSHALNQKTGNVALLQPDLGHLVGQGFQHSDDSFETSPGAFVLTAAVLIVLFRSIHYAVLLTISQKRNAFVIPCVGAESAMREECCYVRLDVIAGFVNVKSLVPSADGRTTEVIHQSSLHLGLELFVTVVRRGEAESFPGCPFRIVVQERSPTAHANIDITVFTNIRVVTV